MIVLDLLLKYLSKREKHLPDPEGDTALHIACFSELTYQKYQIVETLLKNGCDPSVKSYHGYTAFDVIDKPYVDERWNLLLAFSKKKESTSAWEIPKKTIPKEQPIPKEQQIEVGFIIPVTVIGGLLF